MEAFEIRVLKCLDSRLFDGTVHPLGLTVGPGMAGLGQPVLDAIFMAVTIEDIRTEMACLLRHRCKLDRVSFGMLSRRQSSMSFSGRSVRLRNSTIMASSTIVRTVLCGAVGPIGLSSVMVLARHLVTVVRLKP